MDPRRLLAAMAQRLYEDIKFVASQNPKEIVDDDGTSAYNALLARVRKHFSHVDNVSDFDDWSARTIKYKDAMVVAGQLHSMLDSLTSNMKDYSSLLGEMATGDEIPRFTTPGGRTRELTTPVAAKNDSSTAVIKQKGSGDSITKPETPAPLDPELYGTTPGAKVNDDGTIPFSLE